MNSDNQDKKSFCHCAYYPVLTPHMLLARGIILNAYGEFWAPRRGSAVAYVDIYVQPYSKERSKKMSARQ